MTELMSRHVDWGKDYEFENWESVCPFCHGEGEVEVVTEVEYTCWGNDDCPKLDFPVEPVEKDGVLVCSECGGEVLREEYKTNEWCEYCEGNGHISPMWNTVWDLGYNGCNAVSEEKRREVLKNTSCAVMWNYEDRTWYLCLTGCGMNLTASLAKAMMILGFRWLPDSWAHEMAKDMDFATYIAGEKAMPQLKDMMMNTAQSMIREGSYILEQAESFAEGVACGFSE